MTSTSYLVRWKAALKETPETNTPITINFVDDGYDKLPAETKYKLIEDALYEKVREPKTFMHIVGIFKL